jgi:hypothetical protein
MAGTLLAGHLVTAVQKPQEPQHGSGDADPADAEEMTLNAGREVNEDAEANDGEDSAENELEHWSILLSFLWEDNYRLELDIDGNCFSSASH